MDKGHSSLIDASKVLELIGNEEVIFIDARGGKDAYENYLKGHLKGANFIDLERELSEKTNDAKDGGRHPLPDTKKFIDTISSLGVIPSSKVIIYDDKSGANAASRLWWMMKSIGHKDVKVIDGGLTSIIKAGLPIVTDLPSKPLTSNLYPYKYVWELPTIDLKDVQKATETKDCIIIDVRENYRYRGESEPIDLIAGHIPTSINIPYINNLDDEGNFVSSDKLKQLYSKYLQDKNLNKVIIHCGSGVTACHTILALQEAGFSTPLLYVGSWSEWSRNELPIEKEDEC